MNRLLSLFVSFTLALSLPFAGIAAQDRSIMIASTTSTDNSGLFAHILPIFEAATGIKAHVVAVGTGQALELGRKGDADIVFVHDKPSEETFIAEGYGVERRDVMYNDFVLVGPSDDPAEIDGGDDVVAGFVAIAKAKAIFASRGDNSGTNKAELRLWKAAGIDPSASSGDWYRETGSGMGATLNIAAGLNAYALTDRGTWLSFQNKKELKIVIQGDGRLFNQYGVMLVDPARHAHVKAEDGRAFIDWITSPEGQNAIASFRVAGQQLFFPNYDVSE